jgi:two-component system CheB/CheR fusion protein
MRPEVINFPIADILSCLKKEFAYHTKERGLGWRVMPCRLMVRSDPRLLEMMLRNLLNNALKYTEKGSILVGCRQRGNAVRIEVWDTGIGIPEDSLKTIFEEFRQVPNLANQSNLGVGLGLAIVRHLGQLLDHAVDVRSWLGHGSVFSVTVPKAPAELRAEATSAAPGEDVGAPPEGVVLIVDDDEGVRDSLQMLLQAHGYRTAGTADGVQALALVARREFVPDLAIVDYNLPGAMNGIEVGAGLRNTLGREFPVIVLTGEVSSRAVNDVAPHGFLLISKPIQVTELLRLVSEKQGKRRDLT